MAWNRKRAQRRWLMERQSGLCAACEQPLEPDAAPNSDLYPTLDHIVPASEGGA